MSSEWPSVAEELERKVVEALQRAQAAFAAGEIDEVGYRVRLETILDVAQGLTDKALTDGISDELAGYVSERETIKRVFVNREAVVVALRNGGVRVVRFAIKPGGQSFRRDLSDGTDAKRDRDVWTKLIKQLAANYKELK